MSEVSNEDQNRFKIDYSSCNVFFERLIFLLKTKGVGATNHSPPSSKNLHYLFSLVLSITNNIVIG